MESILLKDATIYDGSETPSYKANILISKGKITYVGTQNKIADKVIDCNSKIVTPGFIDVHAHSELRLASLANNMCEKVNQGITTEISGNCGIGCFPVNSESLEDTKNQVKDVLGDYSVPWSWSDFNSFSSYIQKNGMSYNMAFLTAHSALRYYVLKDDIKRAATEDEIQQMCSLLDTSLKQGSVGLSTGLYYSPCLYADSKEIDALLKVVKENDKYFTSHHRCEGGDSIYESLQEVLELALRAQVKFEVSHLKVIGKRYQDQVDKILALIKQYRAKGLEVAFDQYPYDFGSTSLFSLLPPSVLGSSRDVIARTLQNKENRKKIKKEILEGETFDSVVKLCGFDDITILSLDSHPEYNGKSFSTLAKELKIDPFDLLFDILIEEKGSALMEDVTQTKESIVKIMKEDLCIFGSDALYSGRSFHKRSYFASLERLSYHKELGLDFLIPRMTGFSALRFNLKNIGFIKEGYNADILVINLDKLSKENTDAIETVIINGIIAKENNEFKAINCGRVIANKKENVL